MNTFKRLDEIAVRGHERIDNAPEYHYSDSKKKKSHQAETPVGKPRGMREVSFGSVKISQGILLSRILT